MHTQSVVLLEFFKQEENPISTWLLYLPLSFCFVLFCFGSECDSLFSLAAAKLLSRVVRLDQWRRPPGDCDGCGTHWAGFWGFLLWSSHCGAFSVCIWHWLSRRPVYMQAGGRTSPLIAFQWTFGNEVGCDSSLHPCCCDSLHPCCCCENQSEGIRKAQRDSTA